MSALVARIMLTIFMLPCAAIGYFLAAMTAGYAMEKVSAYYVWYYRMIPFAAGLIVFWGIIALYWLLLWRKTVRWTDRRRARTRMATLASIVVGIVLSLPLALIDWSASVFMASIVTPVAWLIWTTLLWQETADERADRVAGAGGVSCPNCGYNLTGLRGTRCPECGKEFTLEELLATQALASGEELASREAIAAR